MAYANTPDRRYLREDLGRLLLSLGVVTVAIVAIAILEHQSHVLASLLKLPERPAIPTPTATAPPG